MTRADSRFSCVLVARPRQRGVAHVVVEVEVLVVDPDRVVLERDPGELLAVARDPVQRAPRRSLRMRVDVDAAAPTRSGPVSKTWVAATCM